MNTQEQKESDLIDTICKCRKGSMGDKQFRATVEHVLSQAIQTEREATTYTDEGKDELYCAFWRCSTCNESSNPEGSNYCLNCGRKFLSSKESNQ